MEIHEFYIPSSSGIANLHCMEWCLDFFHHTHNFCVCTTVLRTFK